MSKNLNLKTALIITTYNQPELLELSLETALRQKVAPYEIIVADDGSEEKTESVVREAAKKSTVTIKHVWQQDLGFRLNHSRNNAIAVAESEYLSLIDGDCFLDEWFIHDHIYFARQGRYNAGRRIDLNQDLRPQILQTRGININVFDLNISMRKKFHFMRSFVLANMMSSYWSKTKLSSFGWRYGVLGANLAFFKADAIRVNGFNELWNCYGEEDLEFCARLERSGIRKFKLRHCATNYHFSHDHLGVVSKEKKLTATNPKYLASVNESQTRCVDSLGLTRALSQKRTPIIVDGYYQKYLF